VCCDVINHFVPFESDNILEGYREYDKDCCVTSKNNLVEAGHYAKKADSGRKSNISDRGN
jgi:hypothetical protein